ncbi:MAG: DUF1761 domain-containing protein [Candidatus Aenigmarchaeota archaeon]|nr:DUF1761 domain-containing protein [Candidatus Aenigmarchaeota archaeon]
MANMLIGMAWYSPALFGKYWSAYSGVTLKKTGTMKKSEGAKKAYAASFIGAIVTAYVLAYFLYYTGSTTVFEGAKKGAIMWAVVAAAMAGGALLENKPKELFVINSGYHLFSFMVMGAMLAVWA